MSSPKKRRMIYVAKFIFFVNNNRVYKNNKRYLLLELAIQALPAN